MIVTKRRGPPKGIYRKEPIFRDKVLRIVQMRDLENATFEKISREVGGTRMNACNSYHRWRYWAQQVLQIKRVQQPEDATAA